MSDSSRQSEHPFHTITNRDTHDQLVAKCTKHNVATILHVYNSAIPRCQSFLTKFESWAKNDSSYSGEQIQYAKMDYTSETSFMFKFAPNQLPITVLMVGQGWARTVTGTDLEGIESSTEEMMGEHRRLTGGR